MSKRIVAAISAVVQLLCGCNKESSDRPPTVETGLVEEPAPKELPPVPFNLSAPRELPGVHDGKDLSRLDSETLAAMAMRAASKQDYKTALAAQFWAVKKSQDGYYNLACYFARNELFDEAMYCLQKAAIDEWVDTEHTLTDPDLKNLLEVPKFRAFSSFLHKCEAYWKASKHKTTVLYVPRKLDKSTPTPVLVCLHPRWSSPKRFLSESLQEHADKLGMPVVSVSGTQPRGPNTFIWAGQPLADAKRIDAALHEVSDRITVAPSSVVAMGYAEGAQVALEIAARDPEKFAGAIALGPTGQIQLDQLLGSVNLKNRRYVVAVGANDYPADVRVSERDRDRLEQLGASVRFVTIPNVGAELPRDIDERLPKWIAIVLGKE